MGLNIRKLAGPARNPVTWYVIGVRHTPFGVRYHLLDSKTCAPDNLHLLGVTDDAASEYDYVVIATERLAYERKWFRPPGK